MDKFLDKYVQESAAGKISSPQEFNIDEVTVAEKPLPKDSLDTLLSFLFRHPLMSITVIVLPLSLAITPLRTSLFSTLGVILIGMVLLNASLLYVTGLMIALPELSFGRMAAYAIPPSIIISFSNPTAFPIILAAVVNMIVILLALRIETGIFRGFILNMVMVVLDYIYLIGISMAFASLF